jgi:hypothetical protein
MCVTLTIHPHLDLYSSVLVTILRLFIGMLLVQYTVATVVPLVNFPTGKEDSIYKRIGGDLGLVLPEHWTVGNVPLNGDR